MIRDLNTMADDFVQKIEQTLDKVVPIKTSKITTIWKDKK